MEALEKTSIEEYAISQYLHAQGKKASTRIIHGFDRHKLAFSVLLRTPITGIIRQTEEEHLIRWVGNSLQPLWRFNPLEQTCIQNVRELFIAADTISTNGDITLSPINVTGKVTGRDRFFEKLHRI